MPLQVARAAIQFAGGVETKQDPKQVPPVQLLDLQNATFIRKTTLAKRNGYKARGNTVEGTNAKITGPKGLAARGSELVQFAGTPTHGYSYVDATDRWSDIGPIDSTVVTAQPIARTGTDQSAPDVATNRGVTVAAWEDSNGGVWASVLDAASLRVIVQPTQLDALGTRPRCVRVGQVLHILYAVASLGLLYVVVVNPANPTAALAPQILAIDLDSTNPAYDAESTGTGYNVDQPAVIVWCNAAGVSYRIGYLHQSGALGSPALGLPPVATVAAANATTLAVAWWQTNPAPAVSPRAVVLWPDSGTLAVKYRIHDGTDFTSLALPSGTAIGPLVGSFVRIAAAWDDAKVWVAAEGDNDSLEPTQHLCRFASVTAAGVSTEITTLRGHGLASRAFYDQGGVCAAFVHPALFFSYCVVARISAVSQIGTRPSVPVAARCIVGQSPGLPTRTHLPSVVPIGVDVNSASNVATSHAVPMPYRIQVEGPLFTEAGIQLTTIDFANPNAWQSAELGRGLYVTGGCAQHYDGRYLAEADFHAAPDTSTGVIDAVAGAGGALTPSGKYLYQLCYEAIDNQGELHRGPVTPGPLISMGPGVGQVTLTIPTCRLTNRPRVRVGVYRSLFNQVGDPTMIVFSRVASIDPTTAGTINGYVLSDPTVDTVTFVDQMSDNDLANQDRLYTVGGVLSNDPAPIGGGALVTGGARIFATDQTDPNMVRYSQQRADDTALEMPIGLSDRTDPYGGAVVAIGILDDARIVFKESAIYAFAGPGPNPNPNVGQEAFTPPQLLTSDVGCKAPRSICQSPIGIVFQSEKGIKLVGRDRQVIDIGAAVYAYNGQTVARATLLPDRHQIVFLTSAGRTLLYDYEHQQWSTYTNHEGVDAVVLDGVYHYLRNDGRVFSETIGQYADDNSQIPMLIETAWIKMGGVLQGWQRVLNALVIGEFESAHTLRMRYRLDYEAAYSTPIDCDQAAIYLPDNYGDGNYGDNSYGGVVGVSSQVYQTDFHLNQRCQAISFRFEDIEPTGAFGASFQLSELLLIGGELGPKFRVGAARQS